MGFVGEGAYSFGHEQEGGEKRFHGDSGVNRVTGLTPIFQCGMFDALFLHEKVWGGHDGSMLLD